ncbi:transcription/translation regulatory transformer protein RfaH [Vibrio salinus]|uniref:transcription/translation regulatory transformer protein RfaH n=1 Tax=Vibrio salinus TaxID=2899784 RepID=UPI001E5D6118|nr:transcription/translation regulatory transformer protein RfaH [Vibrio salinus]MCE0492987.1 transcription/translation regulatory transformer protein RfaH [Vibrio salinus]
MKKWYLLYCKRGDQARAKQHLSRQNVECFYPEIKVEKILRGKKQVVQEPLFPSYVFVNFDYEAGPSFTTVRSTRGVVDFIRFGNHPAEVNEQLIDELQAFEPELSETKVMMPKKGQAVRVKAGQFAGIDAIYQEPDGETRSFMLIKLINRPVSLSIDNKDLEL